MEFSVPHKTVMSLKFIDLSHVTVLCKSEGYLEGVIRIKMDFCYLYGNGDFISFFSSLTA